MQIKDSNRLVLDEYLYLTNNSQSISFNDKSLEQSYMLLMGGLDIKPDENRMSQLMYLSSPSFFGSMDFRVFVRLLRECLWRRMVLRAGIGNARESQKLNSRIELERKTVVENKVCTRISRHGAVLDQTALGDQTRRNPYQNQCALDTWRNT